MQFPLDLTENNVKRLVNGHPIQLKAPQLKGDKHYIVVHPATHQRLVKARGLNKGARINLTAQELAASGEGFKDLWQKVKKGAQWVKQNVIDTALYQTKVKPIVRQAVESAVASLPLPAPVAGVAKVGVEKLGEVTGAFGLEESPLVMTQPKKKRVTKKGTSKPRAKKSAGGSFMIN